VASSGDGEVPADEISDGLQRGLTAQACGSCASNGSPFSESHLKTLTYQQCFPRRFGCSADAKAFCRQFFDWYNHEHHHTGVGLMTPDQVHYRKADAVHAARQKTLDRACRDNPERVVNKPPKPPAKPTAAWVKPPSRRAERQA